MCIGLALWATKLMVADDVSTSETPPDHTFEQIVAEELPQLGSGVRSNRMAAEERLLEAGPAVLEWLPHPESVDDAATREALWRIRSELERRAARASVKSARVTLRGEMPLAVIVEQIASQTGNRIALPGHVETLGATRIHVDYDDAPFWDVLRDLAGRVEIDVTVDTERQSVVLSPDGEDQSLARTTDGAFLVEVLSLRPRDGVLGIEFAITPEPRLRPLFLSWADADFTARTTATELRPFSPDAQRELPAVDRGPVRFSVVFVRNEDELDPSDSVALAGSLVVTTTARTQEFRFGHLAAAIPETLRTGGVSVTRRVAEFTTTRRGVRRAGIELQVAYDAGGPAFESHRTWVYHNEVYLETPDGTRLPVNDGFTTLGEQDGAVAVRYQFRDLPDVPPDELELVYHAPTAVIEVPIEFEFEAPPVRAP